MATGESLERIEPGGDHEKTVYRVVVLLLWTPVSVISIELPRLEQQRMGMGNPLLLNTSKYLVVRKCDVWLFVCLIRETFNIVCDKHSHPADNEYYYTTTTGSPRKLKRRGEWGKLHSRSMISNEKWGEIDSREFLHSSRSLYFSQVDWKAHLSAFWIWGALDILRVNTQAYQTIQT